MFQASLVFLGAIINYSGALNTYEFSPFHETIRTVFCVKRINFH